MSPEETSPAIRSEGSRKPAAYWLVQHFTRLIARGYFRARVVGASNFPSKGPCLILANHASFLDPGAVGSMIEREIHFLARESLFRIPFLRSILRVTNTHPIRREGVDRAAIKMCVEILRKGWPLLIFPEGTRSPDGRVQIPRGGFGMILEQFPDVPLVPLFIEGAHKALGRGSGLPRPVQITLRVGSAFRIEAKGEDESRRAFYERCTQALQEHWRPLCSDPALWIEEA